MNALICGAMLTLLTPILAQTPNVLVEKVTPVLVCDVLSDLAKFNGKIISIRGVVEGSNEGTWIIATRCAVRLVTDGYLWRTAIAIELPSTLFLRDDVDFQLDRAAIEWLDHKVKQMQYKGTTDTLWLTYIGLFETKKKLEVGVDPSGKRWPDGFGHLNTAPGRLLIKTVSDTFVERGKRR
jgi:hypothetical protein